MLVAVMIIMVFSSVPISHAVPPSDCKNRLDTKITAFRVNNGKKTTEVTSKGDPLIIAKIQKGYKVRISLQVFSEQPVSKKGNIYLTTTAYGFSSGTCFDNIKISSHDRAVIVVKKIQMGQATNGLVQPVHWGSWPNVEEVNYGIIWR
jgi:hypothetical protein